MEKIADLYEGISLWKVPIADFREQDINARVMASDKFDQLKDNIEKDGRLESIPLGYFQDHQGSKQAMIISGHHRVRSARMANVPFVFTMIFDEKLTHDQVRAKQLAHNALNGYDDKQILKQIWDSIEDIKQRIASGVKEEELKGKLESVKLEEINFEFNFEVVKILFLPTQLETFEKVLSMVEKNEKVRVATMKDWDKFSAAVQVVSKNDDIRSIAAIISKMSEIVIKHYEEVKKSEKSTKNKEK